MKSNIGEKLLVYRVQQKKDKDAFAELYDLYIEKIYRFIYVKVSHKEQAEDLTSEVFLKTWNYLVGSASEKSDLSIKSFSGLIYKIARNSVVDFYRKNSSRAEYGLEAAEEIFVESREFETVQAKTEMEQMLRVLKKMKREYQEIVMLRYIEELSVKEIAEILGKNVIAVRVTLHRALQVLKKLMERNT
ncbi:MAG: RNA polymerase sigma factor [Candidatus Magasanikbacteria bacterium]